MKGSKKGPLVVFGLSFMDCICCGFGAIILLLVMNKGVNSGAIAESAEKNEALLRKVQDEIAVVRGEALVRNIELQGVEEQKSEELAKVARLREQEDQLRAQFAATKDLSEIIAEKERALFEAKQKRDESRKMPPAWRTDVVGGIPADSEYVIFIIDTSGSMKRLAAMVSTKLKETLSVYPRVKGMQILDADGKYLLGSPGGWLAADQNGRTQLLKGYVLNKSNSSSSPVGGLIEALQTYGKSGLEISVYVFGDDFAGNLDQLAAILDSRNPVRADGRRMIRIHAVGFPGAMGGGGWLFAHAMREITHQHDGAFVTVSR